MKYVETQLRHSFPNLSSNLVSETICIMSAFRLFSFFFPSSFMDHSCKTLQTVQIVHHLLIPGLEKSISHFLLTNTVCLRVIKFFFFFFSTTNKWNELDKGTRVTRKVTCQCTPKCRFVSEVNWHCAPTYFSLLHSSVDFLSSAITLTLSFFCVHTQCLWEGPMQNIGFLVMWENSLNEKSDDGRA